MDFGGGIVLMMVGAENINSKRHINKIERNKDNTHTARRRRKIEKESKTKGNLGGSGGTRMKIKTDIVTKFLVICVYK